MKKKIAAALVLTVLFVSITYFTSVEKQTVSELPTDRLFIGQPALGITNTGIMKDAENMKILPVGMRIYAP